MRAVVDTNVLVSGLIRPRGPIGLVIRGLRDRRFVSVVSRPMLEEVVDVLGRAWLREKYELGAKDVETFLRFLVLRSELVEPTVDFEHCRDPHDDVFLEAALAARVVRLVTGDNDLLALGSYERIRIVSPADFATELD
jgi:putative PIN family toxin of toxin-antitoxin system